MKSGIYHIKNKTNNKKYIGSAIDLKSRFRTHVYNLKNNLHHSKHLQNAWNKYGSENFEFVILECVEKEKLIEREQYYLDLFKSYREEYNSCPVAGSPLGTKQSPETIMKKIAKIKGLKRSEETRDEK